MDNLYIVMPAYNEAENIENTIKSWYPLLYGKGDNSKLVVADSGCTDNTHAILENLQKEYSNLIILQDTERFHGPKIIALYDYAIQHNADYIFQTDSDGQTNPDEFAIFWKERENYEGIFGNRIVREDGQSRKFVENVLCKLLFIFFKVNIPDANAPFRLMHAKTVQKYLYRLPKDYNLPNVMITTYFSYYKEKIVFKTISFKPRQGGINSVNMPKIIKIGLSALYEFAILKKSMMKSKHSI